MIPERIIHNINSGPAVFFSMFCGLCQPANSSSLLLVADELFVFATLTTLQLVFLFLILIVINSLLLLNKLVYMWFWWVRHSVATILRFERAFCGRLSATELITSAIISHCCVLLTRWLGMRNKWMRLHGADAQTWILVRARFNCKPGDPEPASSSLDAFLDFG
jgi:hypothetical protein